MSSDAARLKSLDNHNARLCAMVTQARFMFDRIEEVCKAGDKVKSADVLNVIEKHKWWK